MLGARGELRDLVALQAGGIEMSMGQLEQRGLFVHGELRQLAPFLQQAETGAGVNGQLVARDVVRFELERTIELATPARDLLPR